MPKISKKKKSYEFIYKIILFEGRMIENAFEKIKFKKIKIK